MISEKLKHTLMAYLILILVLWLAWSILVSPLLTTWGQYREISTGLQTQINMYTTRGDNSRRTTSKLGEQLESLLGQHLLGGPASASVSGHQLQTRIKQALQQASATVLELRPRSVSGSAWINQGQLDVSFRIPAEKLETLFDALGRQRPKLDIKLMSLRESRHSAAGSSHLEARLTVNTWHVSDTLSAMFGGLTPMAERASEIKNTITPRPELAGLFNAVQRKKLRNPSADHYRLSAVTLSADARIAIIADLQSGATRRMKEGERMDGWIVKSIDSDGVQLQSGKLTATLRLQKNR